VIKPNTVLVKAIVGQWLFWRWPHPDEHTAISQEHTRWQGRDELESQEARVEFLRACNVRDGEAEVVNGACGDDISHDVLLGKLTRIDLPGG
jgi:hypothetical protein